MTSLGYNPRRWCWVLTIAITFALGGCEDGDSARNQTEGQPGDTSTTRQAQEGPVTLTLSVTPDEFDIARHAMIRMEIVAEKNVTIHPEPYQRTLADDDQRFDYRVVRASQLEARPAEEGKLRWVYECELEFFLPGDYELPAAKLSYVDTTGLRDTGENGAATLESLATETLPISVHQAVEQELSAEELADIKALGPIELAREWGYWLWLGPLVTAMFVLLVIFLLRRRHRLRTEIVETIPADIWARREIAALAAEDLVAKGLVKRFYYRVSDIVRGYVERRFDVLAPEMTTEEFLTAASTDRRFGEHNTNELVGFLDACDRVKYAKHEPHADESDRLIKAAGAFVERTREGVGDHGAVIHADGVLSEPRP